MKLSKVKIKFLTIVLLSCALLLAGCKKQPPQTQDEQITLIWWNLFEPKENVQPVIDAYQALHPNVTIDYAERDIDNYRLDLESTLTDEFPETGPDIFTLHNTWTETFESFLSPAASSDFSAQQLQDDFYGFVSDDFVNDNGFVVGVPIGVDTIAVIYNKDLLEASGYTAPATDWDDFQNQAVALTKKEGSTFTTAGFSAAVPSNTEFSFDMVNLFMVQSGGSIVDEDGDAVFAEDPAIQGALESYLSFIQGTSPTWNKAQEFDAAAFLNGKLAMYAAPSWRLLDIIKYNDEYNLGLDIGTSTMPQLETITDERIYWPTYWGQVVSKDSANSSTSWDFLKFLTSAENLRTINDKASQSRSFGQIYPRKSMSSEINEDLLGAYLTSMEFAKSWEMVDGQKVKVVFDDFIVKSATSFDQQAFLSSQAKVNDIIENKGNLGSSPQN